ncbi:MAG: Crp/Fnr family transcriptional regulator [Blastocatellales bacterium]
MTRADIKVEAEERCSDCDSRERHSFCALPKETLSVFDYVSFNSFFPQGTKLFGEGQVPRGVFIICSGRAKLSIGSNKGKALMRVAEAGDVLGLGATLTGQPYEASAEMIHGGQVNFIRRDSFLNLMKESTEAGICVAEHLSREYFNVHEQVKTLALSDSVAEKLAKLLLNWSGKSGIQTGQGTHLKFSLTHGEVGQMIGASRETVTRLLGEWRMRGIIQIKGSNLFIANKQALEEIVN